MAKWRILAIDDRTDTLEIIREVLEKDYDVITLSNPYQALDMVRIFEPDVILLDILMPQLSGFKLLELLKSSSEHHSIPIIILSCKDGSGDIKFAYKLGAALYLTKPFEPERLKKNLDLFFNTTPPPRKPKQLTLEQVTAQVKLFSAYREGIINLPSHLLHIGETDITEEETYPEQESTEPWID